MILVSLKYDGGVAAVYRDAEGAWLCAGAAGNDGDPASLGGTLLDTRAAWEGIGTRRLVVGGLLPPGASCAIVDGERAEVGNGAWVAVIDALGVGYDPAVRYEADDGTIVRPALPTDWTSEPVSDADVPCPACGAMTWERVTPTDDSRGVGGPLGGPMKPSAVLVCARCGHEVGEGTWYGPGRVNRGAWAAVWRRLRIPARRRAHHPTGHLPPAPPEIDALEFPVYALVSAKAERSGTGSDREGVHSVTMRSDRVEVTSRAPRRAFDDADHDSALALRQVIHDAEPLDWGSGSNAARALRINAHQRAVDARVARAQPLAVELPVDGAPARFIGLRDPAGWAAVADLAQARIVVAASRIEPQAVALRKL